MILYGPEDPPVAIVTILVSSSAEPPSSVASSVSSEAPSSSADSDSPPSSPQAAKNRLAARMALKYLLSFIFLSPFYLLSKIISEPSLNENAICQNNQQYQCVLVHENHRSEEHTSELQS